MLQCLTIIMKNKGDYPAPNPNRSRMSCQYSVLNPLSTAINEYPHTQTKRRRTLQKSQRFTVDVSYFK